MATHHLTPYHALGRDYSNSHDVKMALLAGKDFTIADVSSQWDGKPMNLSQTKLGDVIYVRYANLRKVARIVCNDKFKFENVLTKAEKQVLVDLFNKRPHVCPIARIEISLRDNRLINVQHGNFSLTEIGENVARNIVSSVEALAAS